MAPMGVFNVEGGGIEAVGNGGHFLGSHKKKNGGGIDKAPDEPGTGDAVDLRPGAGHPNGAAFGIALGDFCHGNKRQFCLLPINKPAFQSHGIGAELAQPSGGSLAQFCPVVADNNDGFSGMGLAPFGNSLVASFQSAGNEAGVGFKVFLGSDIDDDGC